jgi:hypothetical protein
MTGLGLSGLALSESGSRRRESNKFQQLTRLMGEAEMVSKGIAKQEVGGPLTSDRNLSSVINHNQQTGTIVRQVGGLGITSDPVFSRSIGNVVFIVQEEPGGSN